MREREATSCSQKTIAESTVVLSMVHTTLQPLVKATLSSLSMFTRLVHVHSQFFFLLTLLKEEEKEKVEWIILSSHCIVSLISVTYMKSRVSL